MQEFEETAWRCLDGGLPEDDAAAFQETLLQEPANADRYVRLAIFHQQVRATLLRQQPESGVAGDALGGEAPRPKFSSTNPKTRHGRGPVYFSPPVVSVLSVCATVLLLYLAGVVDLSSAKNKEAGNKWAAATEEAPEVIPPTIAATLTGAVDCRWEDGFEAGYGEFLAEGREVRLIEGLAQVTFECGAKVVMQGPARLLAVSDIHAEMAHGKISVVCPQEAKDFKLRTPTSEIVDNASEFAVQVDESGDSEIHVMRGEVVTRRVLSQGEASSQMVPIAEKNAFRFTSTEQGTQGLVRFNRNKFVREIRPRLKKKQLPPLPVGKDLALWLAADVLVKVDEQNGVLAWRDIVYGDNQSAEDALSVYNDTRPVWTPKGMHGKPAIRFDGQSYLVTTPLRSTDNQSIFVVYSRSPEHTYQGTSYQLISYNGPPKRSSVGGWQPAVLQLGRVGPASKRDKSWMPDTISGFVYYVQEYRGRHSGFTHSEPLPADQPMVVSYIYDFDGKASTLAINGNVHSVGEVNTSAQITSRKVLGRHGGPEHYLQGEISEVLIYNAALSKLDRNAVEEYLTAKYMPLAL